MTEAVLPLIGVVLGAALIWLKDIWSDWRHRKRAASYLALRIVSLLDRYVEQCVEVVQDDGKEEFEQGDLSRTVPASEDPQPICYPDDVDWKSIDQKLTYRILALPNEAAAARKPIDFVIEHIAGFPDYSEFFEERQYQYAQLGLRAAALTKELRSKYGIPELEADSWDPCEVFEAAKKKVQTTRKERQEEQSKFFKQLETST